MKNIFYITIVLTNILNACSVCFGAPDHPVTQGMNKAIFFLLSVITFILLCIMYGMFSIFKRSKNIETKGEYR